MSATTVAATVISSSSASAPPDSNRFAPGQLIGSRYRIVAMLGRGGMGEVYRADDLKLGQAVALKFLPIGFERDSSRLQLLMDEVRTARQVSHPNVCRVHDIDEFEGQHFLSMEYVDGEDLASLLRRIGRLPEERAVTVARQICAGLAAAHNAGVLHRDLKPANVMLDGRGQVKLTDFGLASLVREQSPDDPRVGTPAYMAPEQVSGSGASERSDIYALGLVLYELFTGHAVFQADSAAEMSSLHASAVPSRPSSHVDSLDPVIERAVLRCLEKDPQSRPPTALSVAASLPGGDPLAAALAAGETPSPELVAESGTSEALPAPIAALLALAAVILIVGGGHWVASMSWINFMPFEKRPEVLQDRALELLAELGYTEEVYTNPADRAWGWLAWGDVMRSFAATDSTPARYEDARGRPDVGGYWYRQSPQQITPLAFGQPVPVRGPVGLTNPQAATAGEVLILFDLDGSLRRLELMPRRFAVDPPSEPDWGPLFAAAELDTALFEPVMPRYQRFLAPDLRRAWLGTTASQPGVEYRVEAGASEGRPVLFNVAEASTLEELAAAPEVAHSPLGQRLLARLPALLILVVIILLARLALRNAIRGRYDARGSRRIAFALGGIFFLSELMRSHRMTGPDFLEEIWMLLSGATFIGAAVWALYAAIEPVGRQVWPTMFVSTGRLLSRERTVWRDPMLGRSVLAGLIMGGLYFSVAFGLVRWLENMGTPPWPWLLNFDMLTTPQRALGATLNSYFGATMALILIATLVLVQRALRRRWMSIAVCLVLWTVILGLDGHLPSLLRTAGLAVLLMVTLLRWGALATIVTVATLRLAWLTRTVDYGDWVAQGSTIAIVAVVLLALYGAWAATGRGSGQAAG